MNGLEVESLSYSALEFLPNADDAGDNPKRKVIIGPTNLQESHFKSNRVKTSKYELWNFIFIFLLEEFDPRNRIANVYFLTICCLQCIPQISNTGGVPTTIIPLSIIILIDGIFAILEDRVRHNADFIANSSVARRYSQETKTFVNDTWSNVRGNPLVVTTLFSSMTDVMTLFIYLDCCWRFHPGPIEGEYSS